MYDKEADKFLAYSGISTFWRAPYTRDISDAEIVIMGVPFDVGTTNRSGARLGPRAIREMSLHTGTSNYPWVPDFMESLKIVDYGDVGMSIQTEMTHYMVSECYEHAKRIFKSGARLVTLGGDHTIPYGLLRAARDCFGKITIVHFDSHQDCFPSDGKTTICHGSFAHDLAQEGTIDPTTSTQLFIRTYLPNLFNYHIISAQEAHYMSPKQIAEQVKANAGDTPVYITFDVDALDPSCAPGTGTPVPGGPSMRFVREVLFHMDGLNIIGGDVVEVAPMYDHSQITAMAAAVIAGDIINLATNSLRAKRKL